MTAVTFALVFPKTARVTTIVSTGICKNYSYEIALNIFTAM